MRKLLAMFLVLALMSADVCVIAEAVATLMLPSALEIIDEEAFCGDTSISKVVVADGTTEIRSRAFADSSLAELILPDSLTYIAEDAFDGCGEFALTVPEDCYAYDRCVELGLIGKPEEPEDPEDPEPPVDPTVMESAHPYADEFDFRWIYDAGEGTESVTITFSAETETEEDYDFIYIYTLDLEEVGKYSGTELAGQSVTIDGTGFVLRLTSDEAWDGGNTYYGFKLDSIVPKKAVPLAFESITVESSPVAPGEAIRWSVSTTGGKAPVYYDYTVLLGEEEMATGTVEAPNAIEYVPVRAGEYRLSVIARDSAGAVLPAQQSEAVAVAPSTAYPESAHPYAANTDQTWYYAAEENVESLTVTFSEETETESGYDYIWLYDQNGTQIGKYDGTTLAGQSVEIVGSAFTIRLTSDHVNECYGFTITNIEKYIPGPLSFVSLTADKTKAKTGDLITWTMETEGGRRPVTYEYTITLNDETKYTGTVTRPEPIEYVPMEAGDYTLSVIAKDAEGAELPAQTGKVRITQRDVTPETDFTYEAINGLYARITGYTGTETVVIIPEMIGEYTISEIGEKAFKNSDSLVSVIIPDTVTKLGVEAFCYCDSLAAVDLGEGVVEVCNFAFYGCPQLQSMSFPDSVTTMGKGVLKSCSKLSYVGYPQNWGSANSAGEVFANCPKLTRIDVPVGTTTIPSYAFANCTNLKEITLPEGLEHVHHHAFSNCTGLTEMIYPSTIKTLGGLDGCTGIAQIIIPEGTETIGTNAFTMLPLVSIEVPESVNEIMKEAFKDCTSLENVTFWDGLEIIGNDAFNGCINLEAAMLPDSVTWINKGVFKNCESMTAFSYPRSWSRVQGYDVSVYDFDGYIFEGCIALKSITVPEGVTMIPGAAFNGATYLKEIHLPSTLKEIKAYAFRECTGIQTIDFPNGLETLGISAFEGCTNLEAALLPDSVTWINEGAFRDCVKMTAFNYPKSWSRVQQYDVSVYDFDGYIFEGCLALESITVPEGVTTIPGAAFNGALYLKEVYLPSTLKEIKAYAFRGCEGINAIEFPNGLETIGIGAFEGCTNLEAALLPDSVTWINKWAFRNCEKMITFDYPKSWVRVQEYDVSVYDFDGYIFEGCVALKSITVPEGVTTIPGAAFNGATCLKEVHLPTTLTGIEAYAFRECTGLSKIYLSLNITTIGTDAFESCDSLTIHCEWGSYALQYAIDNSIPYYYLSLTGANIPRGTLYKGDAFALYGYVRSSEAINTITGTIYNSDGTEVLQTITIQPEVNDYNLNGRYNLNFRFGELPLNSYIYELIATAGEETEILVRSSFTIVPPPLITRTVGMVLPSGNYKLGTSCSISGQVNSNYPITSLTAGIYDLEGNATTQLYTVYPNLYSHTIDSSKLDISVLPQGLYMFKIVLISKGESRTITESIFAINNFGVPSGEEVDYNKLVNFFDDPENAEIIMEKHYGVSIENYMTDDDRFLLALHTADDRFVGTVIDILQSGIGKHDAQREYLVRLYKKEIASFLEENKINQEAFEYDKPVHEVVAQSIIKYNEIRIDYLEEVCGELPDELASFCKLLDEELTENIDYLSESTEQILELAEIASSICLDYTQGLAVLESMRTQFDKYHEINEFQEAIRQLIEEYSDAQYRNMKRFFDYAFEEAIKAGSKQVIKYVLKAFGAEVYVAYKVLDLAYDVLAKVTGLVDRMELFSTYNAQEALFENMNAAYRTSFQKIAAGDTSESSIYELLQLFELAKAASLRSMQTLTALDLEGIKTDALARARSAVEKLKII